jgi:Flp pilus assembly pilin Flp
MVTAPRRHRREGQAGQGLVEHAEVFVLVVLVAITSLTFPGTAVTGSLTAIGTSI